MFFERIQGIAFLECAGMLFHNLGPAIENLRSPEDFSLVLGT